MGPTPVYGARAEKPPKNADFAMKQTNICRLSGDIKTNRQTDKLGILAPRGVDSPPQIFRVCRGGCTLHISSKHYMGPTPVYGARAEKPLQNADFAMKQTNIHVCRLSGDIITLTISARNIDKTSLGQNPLMRQNPIPSWPSKINYFRFTVNMVTQKTGKQFSVYFTYTITPHKSHA